MMLLSPEDGEIGLVLAREALEAAVLHVDLNSPTLPPVFVEKRGVFVTLNNEGELRGCIGIPMPVMPLADAIVEAAASAALNDPRFPPVTPDELPDIALELTILSVPEAVTGDPAERPDHVIIGRHGLIIRGRGQGGLLLPQVASDNTWSPVEFLEQTCMKAGLPRGCWQHEDVVVMRFEGQIFAE
ncbi:MAG: TIGR00296 family protein [Methanocalculus sp. MSAO_Arc2]|uniref:TIGR00296 family protein n=1 Tax=Methanocalculus sp. MSAO_Arc2 TaxID=2293855 RepID=UPI000FF28207|nr:MAG: TIGR00296 family protein [Methanocalculus sp. MSAO_Arc2]